MIHKARSFSRTTRHPRETEEQHQIALFQWAALEAGKRPELALMFAVPNGGYRMKATAGKMKATGQKAGVPDIFLPVKGPRGYWKDRFYNGLFIELKLGKNKPTPLQLWWHSRLEEMGYKVVVAYGWPAAKDAIVDYLEGRG